MNIHTMAGRVETLISIVRIVIPLFFLVMLVLFVLVGWFLIKNRQAFLSRILGQPGRPKRFRKSHTDWRRQHR